jgi:hypothetical protein
MADNKVQVNSGGEVFFCFKASNQMRPEYFSDELTNQSSFHLHPFHISVHSAEVLGRDWSRKKPSLFFCSVSKFSLKTFAFEASQNFFPFSCTFYNHEKFYYSALKFLKL